MKRILITGVSGYLGQHLLHKLLISSTSDSENYVIHALYRKLEGFEESVRHAIKCPKAKVYFATFDITNAASISDYVQRHGTFHICIHLAALSSPAICEGDIDQAWALNVPTHLFQALGETPIVALSTDQVYDGHTPIYNELDAPNPMNVYGKTKVEMEQHLLLTYPKVVCLRSSIILGKLAPFGKAHSTFLHFCASQATMETSFYTDEIRNVIAVNDVVAVLEWFCENGITEQTRGVYNMGGKTRASRFDMAQITASECGHSSELVAPARKADQSKGDVPSPLDISMNSTKLENLVGLEFQGLDEIVRATFAS